MSRRRRAEVRKVLPDPKFNDITLTKLMNYIMLDGKKSIAEEIVYGALDIVAASERAKKALADASNDNNMNAPFEIRCLHAALENIMSDVEVRSRRVGGATYQVPMEVRPVRRKTLGIRWLTTFSRKRNEKTMRERLANEVIDALESKGGAVKKREETHKMAEANRAFAHYRW